MMVPAVECHEGIMNRGLRPFTRIELKSTPGGDCLIAMPVGTALLEGRPVRLWLYLLATGKSLDRVVSAASTFADVSLDEEYQELIANTELLLLECAALGSHGVH